MRGRAIVSGIFILVVALVAAQWTRKVPHIQTTSLLPARLRVPGQPLSIPWPANGQAALAVPGVGWMGTHGGQTPVPIASVAKLMTAYLILRDYPLSDGQDGPFVTMSAADVAEYQRDLATGQSCLRVAVGEKLSERQLLEALLLPSANNAANILARLDAGSTAAFVAKMNAAAKHFGMSKTTYVDASGVNPGTVSTAVDQIKIAEQDMTNRTFASIVAMKQVMLPVAGVQYNVDYALGHSGIVGIKTGSTDQAGGCFVFATRAVIHGRRVLLIGAVLGQQPNTPINSELEKALGVGEAMAAASNKALKSFTPLSAGSRAVTLSVPWGQSVNGVITQSSTFVGWPGLTCDVRFEPAVLSTTVVPGQNIGTVVVHVDEQVERIPVVATGSITPPPPKWRLERSPFAGH